MMTFKHCKHCKNLFGSDFFSQKSLYGKLRKAGFTDQEAKEILPACPECVKKLINNKVQNV